MMRSNNFAASDPQEAKWLTFTQPLMILTGSRSRNEANEWICSVSLIGKKGRSLSWNYRVVREVVPVPGDETEDVFTIREVFYDDEGKPELWSADPCSPQGMTHDELRTDLGYMLMALEQATLEMSELPNVE